MRLTDGGVPMHVALIMDGNGRWARERGLPRLAGHKRGAQVLRETAAACQELGVAYLTVYAFSSENWSRPIEEVNGLLALLEHCLAEEEKTLKDRDMRLRIIGSRDRLPASLQNRIARIEQMSAQHKGLSLQIAFGYGARAEIVWAAHQMAKDLINGALEHGDITEDIFAKYLYTHGIPEPDLLIRTGGEQRLSNYLLWQMAYTEFVFLKKHWPDFVVQDLVNAFKSYKTRERRFGATS